MIYLLLSILCSTSLVVILRLFSNYNIKTAHGIVFNYLVCCVTGLLFAEHLPTATEYFNWNGWYACLLLGSLFYIVFNTTGKATTILGVATTSLLFKISFVITVFVALLFLGDVITWNKIIGIICAITAVFLITYTKEKSAVTATSAQKKEYILMCLFVFFGSGACDTGFNLVRLNLIPVALEHVATVTIFFGAFICSFLLNVKDKSLFQWKNIVAGLVLGIPNYGSLYFWIQALKELKLEFNWDSSTVFPINNIGVVCFSAFIGFILFREKFSIQKLAGFVLAVVSIVFIGLIK
ncbi:MAG: EamA family transporter [Chitinophagales bacterium]